MLPKGFFPENYDVERMERFISLVTKRDYTSEALKFISEHSSRLLNLWEEQDLLPFKSKKEKRKKYSFVELVWIHIVKRMRQFGFGGDVIKEVKRALLEENLFKDAKRILPAEKIREILKEFPGVQNEDLELWLKDNLQIEEEMQMLRSSFLSNLVLAALMFRQQMNLLITEKGNMMVYFIQRHIEYTGEQVDFICSDHVSISLNDILNYHLPKDYVQESLKKSIFSEDELAVLSALRQRGIKSVEVRLGPRNKIELIEKKFAKKAFMEQRVSELMMSKGYQQITITAQNGTIISCENKIKQKI